jgi:hypothetical protein
MIPPPLEPQCPKSVFILYFGCFFIEQKQKSDDVYVQDTFIMLLGVAVSLTNVSFTFTLSS